MCEYICTEFGSSLTLCPNLLLLNLRTRTGPLLRSQSRGSRSLLKASINVLCYNRDPSSPWTFSGLFVAELNVLDFHAAFSHLICVFNFSCIASTTLVYQLSHFIKISETSSISLLHFNLLFRITCELENQMIKPAGIWRDVEEEELSSPNPDSVLCCSLYLIRPFHTFNNPGGRYYYYFHFAYEET